MILKRQLALPNLRETSWLCILSAKIFFPKKKFKKLDIQGGRSGTIENAHNNLNIFFLGSEKDDIIVSFRLFLRRL